MISKDSGEHFYTTGNFLSTCHSNNTKSLIIVSVIRKILASFNYNSLSDFCISYIQILSKCKLFMFAKDCRSEMPVPLKRSPGQVKYF
jgi:hypothetical protein